jgi:hypothetical protein
MGARGRTFSFSRLRMARSSLAFSRLVKESLQGGDVSYGGWVGGSGGDSPLGGGSGSTGIPSAHGARGGGEGGAGLDGAEGRANGLDDGLAKHGESWS